MLTDLILSIDQKFLRGEIAHLHRNPHEHTQTISAQLKRSGKDQLSQATIHHYLLIEQHWGSSAAFGFVTTLGTLSRFNKRMGDTGWLETQFLAVKMAYDRVVREYTTLYVNHPLPEVARIEREIKGCPFLAFIHSFADRWGHNFEVGAYGIIGLLQLCEPTSIQTLCE